jgi:hypothetical protein
MSHYRQHCKGEDDIFARFLNWQLFRNWVCSKENTQYREQSPKIYASYTQPHIKILLKEMVSLDEYFLWSADGFHNICGEN